jgi:hypothetical protein
MSQNKTTHQMVHFWGTNKRDRPSACPNFFIGFSSSCSFLSLLDQNAFETIRPEISTAIMSPVGPKGEKAII